MFARIVTYTQADPSPVRIEQGIRRTWERLPGIRELDGIEGAYFFVDRQSGKAIFISLWESEDAMQRSDEMMRPFRAELTRVFAANRVDVEYYEVGENLVQEIRERELLEQELELARSIQQASLPKEVPTLEGWQITPFYQPAREVGGDFYDFFKLDVERVGVVVGYATGKGVPAALVVSTTSSMLRAVARVLGPFSPPSAVRTPPSANTDATTRSGPKRKATKINQYTQRQSRITPMESKDRNTVIATRKRSLAATEENPKARP